MDALKTLLIGESEAADYNDVQYKRISEQTFLGHTTIPCTPQKPYSSNSSTQKLHNNDSTPTSDGTATVSDHFDLARRRPLHRTHSNDQTESCVDNCQEEEQDYRPEMGRHIRIPVHDQRTILISNVAERTTHKDIAGIIRGGRILDIFFRSDHSVTVSFVEGAAEFLAYVKRNDIYLHAKRVCPSNSQISCMSKLTLK